jgi:hypothetical protein
LSDKTTGKRAGQHRNAVCDRAFGKNAVKLAVVSGGFVAQWTDLGVPYLMRVAALGLTFVLAFLFMHDDGFKPKAKTSVLKEMKSVLTDSVTFGFKKAPVRWMMLSGIFTGGVGIYAFYAMQPHLLNLYGDSTSYTVAGISATVVAGAQIVGGFLVPYAGRVFAKRTSFFIFGTALGVIALALIGLVGNFYVVVAIFSLWSVFWAANIPIRQSYINVLLPSEQRATILSCDNMLASAGGVVAQPILGKTADVYGYPLSYIGSAIFQFLALPFIILAKRENADSDEFGKRESASQPAA